MTNQDNKTHDVFNIALLAGDGIGPEITAEAVKVINKIGEKYNHTFNFTPAKIGAAAIDSCGEPYPQATHKVCTDSHAILFGAIGDPRFDNDPSAKVRPEQGLLKMRKDLGLFANIRPLVMFKKLADRSPLKADRTEGVDFVCVRELTGGIYFGSPRGRSEDGKTAFDTCSYSTIEIERIVRIGFEMATGRKKHLTVVDKANVLATSRLWREVSKNIAKEYPDVEVDYMFVDNAAMQLIQRPAFFDVMVTENMFGDILTDEASVISGSLGLL
ncbi:MAG: 3-isopropylmalate dehydrogenase, partial [Rikenellaceae bacterium]